MTRRHFAGRASEPRLSQPTNSRRDVDHMLRGRFIAAPQFTRIYVPPALRPREFAPTFAICGSAWCLILFVLAVVEGWI